jgi:hypothetical protein
VAKKDTRGLPPDFDLDLPVEKPVELGDYLDEELLPRRSETAATEVRAPEVPPPPPPSVPAPPAAVPAIAPLPVYTPQPGYLTRQQLRPGSIPRKQLNATPETMRMLEELLMQIRQQSMEKDVRTSEVFHAMVLAVYEARPFLDLSAVPPRGRWGSPTAASLPVALKNAFTAAIAKGRSRG